MSDTPRTDAHYKQIYDEGLGMEYCETELRYWAEKLECELVGAREELNEKRKFCYDVEKALDGLKGDYVEIIVALRKDAERYRWLRDDAQNTMKQQRAWLASNELDDNIDAAMKEGGK